MLAPPPHKGNARQASALSYQSSSFNPKIVRFRRAADIGVKKITKIGRLATGRAWRMGGGDGARFHGFAADVRPFLPDFNLASAQEREVRRRQAEAREELTSVVIKTRCCASTKDREADCWIRSILNQLIFLLLTPSSHHDQCWGGWDKY